MIFQVNNGRVILIGYQANYALPSWIDRAVASFVFEERHLLVFAQNPTRLRQWSTRDWEIASPTTGWLAFKLGGIFIYKLINDTRQFLGYSFKKLVRLKNGEKLKNVLKLNSISFRSGFLTLIFKIVAGNFYFIFINTFF